MSKLQLHKVLRPLCIGGERVEVDSLVELGPVLGAELRAAAKVERYTGEGEAAKTAGDPTVQRAIEPAARVIKAAKPKASAPADPETPPPEA